MRIVCIVACLSLACTSRIGYERSNSDARVGDPTTSGDSSSAGGDGIGGDALVNGAPTLEPISPATVNEGARLQFALVANDPEQDALTFACVQNCPPGMVVDPTTGDVDYTAQFDHAGTYAASFTVSDATSNDTQLGRITVGNVIRYQGWVGLTASATLHSVWTTGDLGVAGDAEGAFDAPRGVAVDRLGNIYVAEENNNRVQKLSADGSPLGWLGRKLSDGTPTNGWVTGDAPLSGTGAGDLAEPVGLFVDANDALYVTGDVADRVQRFDSAGIFTTSFGSPGRSDGQLWAPVDVAVDTIGAVYVAEMQGNRVQRFAAGNTAWIGGVFNPTVTNGWTTSPAPSGLGDGDGMFSQPTDVAVDSLGNIYVSEWGNDRVQKYNNAGQYIGWTGRRASNNQVTNGWITGDSATEGSGDGAFNDPAGIFAGPGDLIYVTDVSNDRVQVLDSAGGFIGSFGSSGTGDGGFDSPRDVAVDAGGNIYVADNFRLDKFDSSYGFVGWIGRQSSDQTVTNGWITGDSPMPGTMNGAFDDTEGVAVDDNSNRLLVADYGNDRVQVFDLATGVFQTSFPVSLATQVALDAVGNAYVTTNRLGEIVVFDTSYVQTAIHGAPGRGAGEFQRAWGITIAGSHMYVADNNWTAGGQRLQKWTTSGTFIGWIGKFGPTTDTQGWHTGDAAEPSWDPGMFIWPRGLAIDAENDRLYVSDSTRNTISRFVLSTGVFVDRFFPTRYPEYLALDPDGLLLVTADSGFDVYETQSFTRVGNYGTTGTGDGQFRNAAGIAISGYDIYIADSLNNRIQKW